MLILATSLQPVPASRVRSQGEGNWLTSDSSRADPSGIADFAFYISEESETQTGRKGPSHRLGTGDPVAVQATIPSPLLPSFSRPMPRGRAAPADSGLFLAAHKTGPPLL